MHRHFILHKPYGYMSQFVCEHPKKKMLGDIFPFPHGTMPIGRLDEDSEGLLLLTTDGMMSERVRSKKVEKEYHVLLDGNITEEAISKLQLGVEIGIHGAKYTTRPCKVYVLNEDPEIAPRRKKIRDNRHGPVQWISITVVEGKNRQVRKMTAAAGFPTLRLVRVRIGNILLGTLSAGEVREVENFEL